jgi:hypothetical protein
MEELEKFQVQRQLLLRDSSMWSQPTSQQRPEVFHRIDVSFAETVPVIVPGRFPLGVADCAVVVTPFRQPAVDVYSSV